MESETRWEFRVLGPLEVIRAGEAIEIPAAKQRIVLATLLLHHNQYVSADRLAEPLWDGSAPDNARGAVHTHIGRLRRTLGDAGKLIQTREQGYRIEAGPGDLDLARFFHLLDLAARAARAGAVAEEADLLGQALALWRGPVLGNVPSESLHRDRLAGLAERRIDVLERSFDLRLQLGLHAEIVADLAVATTAHPLRERLWAQFMLALYRCGRQAESLEAYRTVERLLRDELGLDPGEELRRLHEAVLSGIPDLQLADHTERLVEPDARSAPGPEWHVLNQLPPTSADLVVRADVIAAGEARAGSQDADGLPIVMLCGPPGVGKSALAVDLAHRLADRFPDGQLYLRLDGSSPGRPRDPAEMLAELLQSTGTHPASIPDGLEQRSAAMRARFAGRRILLLLDDVADVPQIEPLLPGEARCLVLLTSRRHLVGLPGVDVVQMAPFSDEESRELLGRLIGHARVAREPAAADAIAAACGRLPLALRIAGARLAVRPNWSLARLAARLQDESRRLDELVTDDLAVRPSLELSYEALPEPAATAFRRAGLLNGSDFAAWSLGVLAGVADGEPLVEHLLRANLLEAVGTDVSGEPRYRLHDLLSVYARELLADDDPAATRAAARRYMDTLLTLADRCHRKLDGHSSLDDLRPDPYEPVATLPESQVAELTDAPLRWLLAEHRQLFDAVERACDHGRQAQAAALMDRVTPFLDVYVGRQEIERLLTLIRKAALAAGDERLAWRAEHNRNGQMLARGFLAEATAGLRRCVDALERLPAPYEYAHALGALSFCLLEAGEPERAVELAGRAVEAARAAGEEILLAATLRDLASGLSVLGKYDAARELLDRAVSIAHRLGANASIANILGRLAGIALRHGDPPTARSAVDQAIEALAQTDDPYGAAWLLWLSARTSLAEGRPDDGIGHAVRARARFRQLGDQRGEHLALVTEGEALVALGRGEEAAPLLGAAAAALAELGADRMADHARTVATGIT
ncbi:BTAD domain-containing putative transcriptional regulator [Nonomuraea sp. NPDC050786]|uniref:AfsR/SARP family transcriptional regulator n=1 Tax=Nonomuraea sp. NPDC050786 TaxID=3154840 RepID=UPI0033EEF89F